METRNRNKNTSLMAVLAHVGTFGKYFFPFGNFFFPIIVGAIKKDDRFVNDNVKQALNFQISLFLYYILIVGATMSSALIFATQSSMTIDFDFDSFYFSEGDFTLPFFIILGIAGMLVLGLFLLDLVCVITAALRASEGSIYKYPLAIPFLKSSNQSKNEQFNNNNNNTKNETL